MGTFFFSLARFLLQASSFTLSEQLLPAAVARAPPVVLWSDQGLNRSGFGMASMPSIHLKKKKKKKKLLRKQEYPHQADPQPNWG